MRKGLHNHCFPDVDCSLLLIVGNAMPPRDPDEGEEDEDVEDEENRADEPPVVREPDDD